jgi:hypothetical protein
MIIHRFPFKRGDIGDIPVAARIDHQTHQFSRLRAEFGFGEKVFSVGNRNDLFTHPVFKDLLFVIREDINQFAFCFAIFVGLFKFNYVL